MAATIAPAGRPSGRARPPTRRQLEVLALVATGVTRQEAADRLFITERTVQNHLADAYRSLDVNSLVGALLALGWVQVPDGLFAGPRSLPASRIPRA